MKLRSAGRLSTVDGRPKSSGGLRVMQSGRHGRGRHEHRLRVLFLHFRWRQTDGAFWSKLG